MIGISVFIPLCILPMSSLKEKDKLDFSIRADNSKGSAGVTYSYGHVKVNWGDVIIEADSIKIDQNLNNSIKLEDIKIIEATWDWESKSWAIVTKNAYSLESYQNANWVDTWSVFRLKPE